MAEHNFLNAGDAISLAAAAVAAPSSSDLFFFLGDGVAVVAAAPFLTGLTSFVAERDGDLVNALASRAPRARLLVGVAVVLMMYVCT